MFLATTPKRDDRRAEPRRQARGEVKLRPEGFVSVVVAGHLVDVTSSGFRALHGFRELAPGHLVEFEYRGGEGRARVIWTRILGEQVESGFLILPDLNP